ncbi:hypothetical protein TrST_g10687 [Triparma strigata]|uniref:WW domain-containing protein n=1 Tax=Triparma strigata TaxID=1606541 RepID=A0A9W7BW20_9STRA|nr:hypothetical protein TrST_g10687 [Triparma strigata]
MPDDLTTPSKKLETGLSTSPTTPSPTTPSPTTPTESKAAWIQRLDVTSNNFYYENLSTSEKSWYPPSDRYFVPFSPARDKGGAFQISTSTAPSDIGGIGQNSKRRRRSSALAFHMAWSEQQNELGATYFFNNITKEMQWDFPPEWPIPKEEDAWEERTDPESSAKFFYNRISSKTQWTLPEAMAKKSVLLEGEQLVAVVENGMEAAPKVVEETKTVEETKNPKSKKQTSTKSKPQRKPSKVATGFEVGEEVVSAWGKGKISHIRDDGTIIYLLENWTLAYGSLVKCYLNAASVKKVKATHALLGSPRRKSSIKREDVDKAKEALLELEKDQLEVSGTEEEGKKKKKKEEPEHYFAMHSVVSSICFVLAVLWRGSPMVPAPVLFLGLACICIHLMLIGTVVSPEEKSKMLQTAERKK